MTYGGKYQNKGAMKVVQDLANQPLNEVNGNEAVLKKEKEMEECSRIPPECYECICGGKNASGKEKIAHYRTSRPKRAPNLCIGCRHYATENGHLYCNGCTCSYLLIIFLPLGN
jgi:hypothetical protein